MAEFRIQVDSVWTKPDDFKVLLKLEEGMDDEDNSEGEDEQETIVEDEMDDDDENEDDE